MQIHVEGKKLEITAALRNFVQTHVHKLEFLGTRVQQVRVFLENVARKTGEANRAGVTIKVEIPGKDIVVEKKGQDMYSVIAMATERVKFQLGKLKLRHRDRQRGKTRE